MQTPSAVYIQDKPQTLQVTVTQEEPLYVTSKLVYSNPYYFKYINFHLGYQDANGSEHQIDGQTYPIEMQVVHQQNTAKYLQSYLIISYFFELRNMYYWGFKKLLEVALLAVKQPYSKIPVKPFPLKELVYTPSFSYYTYNGSSTTSPYEENVLWAVSAMPLPICNNQLNVFKKLCKKEKSLRNNFRDIQENNFRAVTYVSNV